ncbi:MAG TPA: DALR domain-containing protein, partial [Candidatus Dormibacteraeota bacterium]|nr:DALR domain-containing protein [Candidatus Dormibacteraeota bacterium]
MVSLVERLAARGAAYESEGSYYFSIAAFPAYGRLSGYKAEGLVAGASGRVDADDYDKRNIRDFALWKAVASDEIGWDTRIGRGRPGWHIECSAMSMSLLGETFDIHCGGVDNIFPHHENEIAQSEAATGTRFVRQWCHSAHLLIDLEKMAKRTGNFLTVGDVLADGHAPSALRYMLAATSLYRREVNYSTEPLAASKEAVDRLVAFRDRVSELSSDEDSQNRDESVLAAVREARRGFEESMDDDLNLSEAMGAVFTGVREVNRILDTGPVSESARTGMQRLIAEVDDILGVLALVDRDSSGPLSADEQELLDARGRARATRNFAESDRLRDLLAQRGVLVEDTPQGQRWRRR